MNEPINQSINQSIVHACIHAFIHSRYSALASLLGLRYTPLTLALWLDVGMLIGLGVVFRALAFWSLVLFNRDKRHLPTLAQLSLYWVVNPLDNWAQSKRERRHEARRRERIAAHMLHAGVEVLVAIEATDPITGAPFQARHSYAACDIVFDHAFQPALSRQRDGKLKVDWDYFHALTPVAFNGAA